MSTTLDIRAYEVYQGPASLKPGSLTTVYQYGRTLPLKQLRHLFNQTLRTSQKTNNSIKNILQFRFCEGVQLLLGKLWFCPLKSLYPLPTYLITLGFGSICFTGQQKHVKSTVVLAHKPNEQTLKHKALTAKPKTSIKLSIPHWHLICGGEVGFQWGFVWPIV